MNQCEKMTLLYLSSGAGRGEDINSIDPFPKWQEYFNSLRFQMSYKKGERHGIHLNDNVDHFVPPTLTRYIIVLHLVILPAIVNYIETNMLHIKMPHDYISKEEARLMFINVFELDQRGVGTKECREFIIQVMNFVAPKSLSKTSTTAQHASQFHHNSTTHDVSYGGETFERDQWGNIIRAPLSIAREQWHAFGEKNVYYTPDRNVNAVPSHVLTSALQRILHDPTAQLLPEQMKACSILSDYGNSDNVIVNMPPGSGKTMIMIIPTLARALVGVRRDKILIVSPHNALLDQQKRHAEDNHLANTNIIVTIITSTSVRDVIANDEFDVCYISIHALNDLVENHFSILKSWNIGTIFIDEYHLMFTEMFRYHSAWQALQKLTALDTRLCLLSATVNPAAIKIATRFLGIVNFEMIGSTSTYNVPNIGIRLKTCSARHLPQQMSCAINVTFRNLSSTERREFAVQVVTATVQQARDISDACSKLGLTSTSLTSTDTPAERVEKIRDWDEGRGDVLATTYDCGIDSKFVKEVHVIDCRSACAAIQAEGRCRPSQQKGQQTPATFWHLQYSNDETLKLKDRWLDKLQNMRDWKLFDGIDESDLQSVEDDIRALYHVDGLDRIFKSPSGCLRRRLFETIRVDSRDCKMCDYCMSNNNRTTQVLVAQHTMMQDDRKLRIVIDALHDMKQRCFVCKSPICFGMTCVVNEKKSYIRSEHVGDKSKWCFKCFGYTGDRTGYHLRINCPANNLELRGMFCAFCFICYEEENREIGTTTHISGHCVYHERIKRLLLFGQTSLMDKGVMAARALTRSFTGKQQWVSLLAGNIEKINSTNKSK